MMTKAAIIGAPGYAGVELTRLLLSHSGFELVVVTSSSEAGRAVGDVYPALAHFTDLVYEEPDVEAISRKAEVAFLAVPHTAALKWAPALLEAEVMVVDASADYRLGDPAVYEEWYKVEHTSPHLLEEAVYGLPELGARESLAKARLIACPGCYPTATLLAAVPALESGVSEGRHVVVDAKSGVSGAGRTPNVTTHYPSANEAIAPYKAGTHRHIPEMEQGLSKVVGRQVKVTFVPHLTPMTRGLLATVYMDLSGDLSDEEAVDLYREKYFGEPFITVHGPGHMPSTSEVRGSNRAHIGVAVDHHTQTLIAACAIDNLVKGTSGQAVQCANIASGYEETAGLDVPLPVL